MTAPRLGAEAVVGHEAPRPGPVVELDDEHGAGVAQRVDGALAPQLEVAPEPLAVAVGLDRLEPVVEDVDQDQHAPAPPGSATFRCMTKPGQATERLPRDLVRRRGGWSRSGRRPHARTGAAPYPQLTSGGGTSMYLPPVSSTRPVTARRMSACTTSCLSCRPASASTIAAFLRGTPS